MPKIVDHEARRREIAEALWRITRSDGWEAITLRGVAAEAGVSMGLVQHYFRSKDEMLLFALEIIVEDVRAEIRKVVAALPEPRTPRQLVTAVMMELVPRDRPNEIETAAVFMRRLQLRPESLARLGAGQPQPDLRGMVADQIRLARPDIDADLAASGLIALLEGLLFVVVTGQQSSATARAVMAAQLDYVFN